MNNIDIKDVKDRVKKIDNIRAFLNIDNYADVARVGNVLKENAYIFALENIESYYLLMDLVIDESKVEIKQEKYSDKPYIIYNVKTISKDREKTTVIFLEIENLREYLKNVANYDIIVDKDKVLSKISRDDNIVTKKDLGTSEEFHEACVSFFINLTDVATSVSKSDLITANYQYDESKKQLLKLTRKYVASKYDYNQSIGSRGEDMKAKLDSQYYEMYLDIFKSYDIDRFWNSIFNIATLYRKIGLETAKALEFEYAKKEDVETNKYLRFLYENFGRN